MDVYRQRHGEPMLLLHGIWESWHSFSPVLPALSAEHDVLAPTTPAALAASRCRAQRRDPAADNCAQPERIPPDEAERLVIGLGRCDIPAHLNAFGRAAAPGASKA